MERIYQDLTQLIGNTPLVQLNNLMHDFELKPFQRASGVDNRKSTLMKERNIA